MSDHRENAATACGLIDRWGERGFLPRRKQEILLIMQALVQAEFAREQANLEAQLASYQKTLAPKDE